MGLFNDPLNNLAFFMFILYLILVKISFTWIDNNKYVLTESVEKKTLFLADMYADGGDEKVGVGNPDCRCKSVPKKLFFLHPSK